MVSLEGVGLVRGEATILRGISFLAEEGEVTALVGPSGGGKSSLIRLINRLEEPTSGRIVLDGEDIGRIDPLELRRRVAMVLQKPFMFEGTVLDNLRRPFVYRGGPEPGADSPEIVRALELSRLDADLLSRDARTLSIGQQQRLSLARALATRPRVLLLDEPTSALDRPTADRLGATFREICREEGLTVVLVTHDLRLAGRIGDHLVYLEAGRVIEEGRGDEMLAAPKTPELARFLAEPEGEAS